MHKYILYFVWTLTSFALTRIGLILSTGNDPGIAGPLFIVISLQILIVLPIVVLLSFIYDANN